MWTRIVGVLFREYHSNLVTHVTMRGLASNPWFSIQRIESTAHFRVPANSTLCEKRRGESPLLCTSALRQFQYRRKFTSTLICTATGLPSFIAGSNFQLRTA